MKSTAIGWTKKLFAEGSRCKKIVCVDEMSIPPPKK
jgi:hypothetical protein